MDQINIKSVTHSSHAKNPLLQAILMIIIIVLFGWFILLPKNSAYSEQSKTLDSLSTEKANLDTGLADLNKLISELESSTNDLKLLDEALPLSDRPTKVAILMESYARSSAMLLSQIDIDGLDDVISSGNKQLLEKPFDQKRDLKTVKVNLSLEGTVDQFKNFLTLLETSGRIIDVDSFSVSNGENADRFSLKIVTYAYEPK